MKRLLQRACMACACLLPFTAAMAQSATTATVAKPPDRRIAITFDDLPWATLDSNTPLPAHGTVPPRIAAEFTRLLQAIKNSGTPAIGFVNSARLLVHGQPQPDRVGMLDAWLDAGLELGNHTATHVDLHAVGKQAFENDILACDAVLRPLLAKRDLQPHWFRHPYLRTGRTLQDKAAIKTFLTRHGYRIAPVTITDSDWIWAAAYAKALDSGDTAMQAKLRAQYVPYLLRMVHYFEHRSTKLLGYALPQVMLLHANALNADTYADFVSRLHARGYRFVSLDEAMRDPAYQRADTFTGALGTSWIHRWAIAAGWSWKFYDGEPTSPKWVIDLAGVPAYSE
ncbi:polysaccharide deacetylase family protein [Oleiagrimonas citrea]|uniref:Polysaccharide deacetylase family protein n=1 Tax=Oleiagrimonas citrea TaxID=1665687 RepID=A0A846ZQZ3_9GAMM|nr:polysaccharide deacetylase family protein [Oleiagrimonas citrea]NKZ40000.1 polysaccharide deacetylase family protein [Oleiagrimonas citrea]